MNLKEAMDRIPSTNLAQGESRGMLPSLLDAFTHAGILILTADNPDREPGMVTGELASIAQHLDREHLLHPPFATTQTEQMLNDLHEIGTQLGRTFPEGGTITQNSDELKQLVFDLGDKIRTVCAAIDRELAGIENSTAGTNL